MPSVRVAAKIYSKCTGLFLCFSLLEELSERELQRVRAAYGRGSCEAAAKRWRDTPCPAGGRRTTWRRQVAAAYYLNKDWRRSWGGEFVDLATEEVGLKPF